MNALASGCSFILKKRYSDWEYIHFLRKMDKFWMIKNRSIGSSIFLNYVIWQLQKQRSLKCNSLSTKRCSMKWDIFYSRTLTASLVSLWIFWNYRNTNNQNIRNYNCPRNLVEESCVDEFFQEEFNISEFRILDAETFQ